ncbi:hypothetical protein BGM26_01205 [Bacillus sp. FJAT-29790]|uniref:hypothetical protein n=1 Tax=Bacillus sp. FJAT-29790 TaxID=1895002 RepID=UPI001C226DDC|nr:hypothetical protein [Bacillus sp. FJAT-29790]MBU8877604.1 hypothetical protein [Bacillus sp. FJAT-29790]
MYMYEDFYQKAPIPMGTNDLNCLKETFASSQLKHSHWLIALEGQLKDLETEYYCWKVTVYSSDSNGCFAWNPPCYSSSIFDCIHKAYEHANELERYGRNDQLFSTNLLERIG